jgi:hypothetical protein
MHKGTRFFGFILTTILITSGGCTRKPDDANISNQIQTKYAQDSGLSTKQLSVQTSNGIVTLGGVVDDDAQRAAASRQAAAVDGVKEVVNNLQVGGGSNNSVTASNNPAVKLAPSASSNPPTVRKSNRSGGSDKTNRDRYYEVASNPINSDDTPPPAVVPTDQPPADPAPTPASSSPPPPPSTLPQQPPKVTIEQGTPLSVRLIDSIDSEKNQPGDTFHAALNAPLSAEGSEAIPAGTDVTGHIVDLKSAGKFAGQSLVVLQLDSISSNGKSYSLQTDQFRKEGSSRGKNTAEKVGGGAVLGGIIGAIAGGGKGAVIGTAAGAGVGGGAQAASKSQQIKLPSETVLNFTLQAPVTVIKPTDPNAGRPKLDDSH